MTGKDWLPTFLELVEDGWATSRHSAVFRTVPFLDFSTHALNRTNQPKVQRLSVLPFLEINLWIFSGGGREVSRKEGGSVSHSVLDPTVQSDCISPCPTVALGFIFLVLLSQFPPYVCFLIYKNLVFLPSRFSLSLWIRVFKKDLFNVVLVGHEERVKFKCMFSVPS